MCGRSRFTIEGFGYVDDLKYEISNKMKKEGDDFRTIVL
jgi:hypothetical protein